MPIPREVFDALAELLSYPGEVDWEAQRAAMASVRERCPQTAGALTSYASAVEPLDEGAREELFTRTFDSTDTRSLEIGWQLFGENYARGALMVRLRGLLREHGVPETAELPDHLTHVLRLLGRAPYPLSRALVQGQIGQSLAKMLEGCRAFESPYCGVLEAVRLVCEEHANQVPEAVSR